MGVMMSEFVAIPNGTYEIVPNADWVGRVNRLAAYESRLSVAVPHTVTIDRSFRIADFPVTNAEFEAVLPHDRDWCGPNEPEDDHPVTGVTYYDAVRYCKEQGYRLPTRNEWLVAALGHVSQAGWILANSADADKSRFNHHNPKAQPTGPSKRGEYPANPHGLYDMSGNVSEFVEERTRFEGAGDPAPSFEVTQAMGGSWGACIDGSVPLAAFTLSTTMRNNRVGFRVALPHEEN